MIYMKTLKARHPYEDCDTVYTFNGCQHFNDQRIPLYTSTDGYTVSLESIMKREEEHIRELTDSST